jgi:hypothetical protein
MEVNEETKTKFHPYLYMSRISAWTNRGFEGLAKKGDTVRVSPSCTPVGSKRTLAAGT